MKKMNYLSIIMIIIFSMAFVACSGGGGGGSGGGSSTAPDNGGSGGGGGGNGGGNGTTYSYKGWEVHTGTEATGIEIDSAKKHFQVANAFTMEIVNELPPARSAGRF